MRCAVRGDGLAQRSEFIAEIGGGLRLDVDVPAEGDEGPVQ